VTRYALQSHQRRVADGILDSGVVLAVHAMIILKTLLIVLSMILSQLVSERGSRQGLHHGGRPRLMKGCSGLR